MLYEVITYRITRFVMQRFYFSRLNIRVQGLENIPEEGPALIVGNHPCAVDGHLLCILCPRQFYSFAQAELFEDRLSRWHFRSVGSIPVAIGDDNSQATSRAAQLLREGHLFVLLPESEVYPVITSYSIHYTKLYDSPCNLLQNELVQRQVRDGPAQPIILLFQPLEFLQLVGSHTAILLAPSVIGLLGNVHFADRIHALHPLSDKHINLP